MKSILGIVLCLTSFSAFALPMTFNSIVLDKRTGPGKWELHLNRDITEWCTGLAHGIHLSSFQAAKEIEALADGTYTCQGEFAAVPYERTVEVYSLANCHLESGLDKSCKP